MKNECPSCGSVIYSRRNPVCGSCGQRLPAELVFTEAQSERIQREFTESTRRARAAGPHGSSIGGDIGDGDIGSL